MRIWRAYIGALFVLLASFVSADPEGWSNDTRLTFDGAGSIDPSVVADSQGNVHVIWDDGRDNIGGIYYKKIRRDGTTLIPDRRLTAIGVPGSQANPSAMIDMWDNVHIVWTDTRDGNEEIYYEKLDRDGNAIIDNLRLTTQPHVSRAPTVGVDSGENAHVVWYDGRTLDAELFYKKLDRNGNTLIDDLQITNAPEDSAGASLDFDADGNVHIAWYDNRDQGSGAEIYYTKLNNNGTTLVDDTRMTFAGGSSVFPVLSLDSEGNIHIVWDDTRNLRAGAYYKKLTNNGTTLIQDRRLNLIDHGNVRFTTMGVDPGDQIHVVWQDGSAGNAEIFYERLNGSNGSALINETRLTTNNQVSTTPSIFAKRGAIDLVWSDNRDGNFEVYYKTSRPLNSAPELQSVGDRQTNESQILLIQLQASDPDNDTMTFGTNAASVLPSAFSFNETIGLFEWTPTFRDAGNYTVRFTVSDGASTVGETVTITVHDAPLILQHIGNQEANENQTLALQLQAQQQGNTNFVFGTDADHLIRSQFTFNTSTGLFEWTPTFSDSGAYNISFNVTNGYDVANETVTVTVNNVNLAPEIQPINNIDTVEGNVVKLKVNASDFDGDRITYGTNAESILPSRSYFNESNGEFAWNTGYTDYGNYTIRFTASDGMLTIATDASIYVRDAQLSNLLMVGAPRIGNTVQLLLADRTAINQPYILLMSTETEPSLALGDGRYVRLTPNTVLLVSLNLPTLIGLRESVGIFNSAGNAIATWTVPNVPELVNTTLHLAFVSLDTVQPGARAIISVSPTINTTVTA